MLEVAVLDVALDQRALPEGALALVPRRNDEDDGQRDLALAEIVADRSCRACALSPE